MPKALSRDSWLALALVVALVGVTAIAAARQARQPHPPLYSASTQPDGARALWLWLETLGYAVNNESPARFAIPRGTDLVLILEPTVWIQPQEWRVIDAWVNGGGALILAGDEHLLASWASHYGLDRLPARRARQSTAVRIQHPLFDAPPMTRHPAAMPDGGGMAALRPGMVTHVAGDAGAVIVSFAQGRGRVILSATSYPFSNLGLQGEGTPALVLNLLNLAGPPGRVWFAEWHHGVRPQSSEPGMAPVGINNWLRSTTAGRAVLFGLAVIFLALVMQGRAFGRPTPLPQQLARRTPLEYVTAIANLNRRAGHREALLHDYRLRLKRALGRRYRLDPELPDDEFVRLLAGYSAELDHTALLVLLRRLATPGSVSEQQMVQLAADTTRWLKQ